MAPESTSPPQGDIYSGSQPRRYCGACAEACERMGKGDEMMAQCAEECRRCQQSCERMAA